MVQELQAASKDLRHLVSFVMHHLMSKLTRSHKAVRGLWMSCGKCKHGGHQSCLRAYFGETTFVHPRQSLTGS